MSKVAQQTSKEGIKERIKELEIKAQETPLQGTVVTT